MGEPHIVTTLRAKREKIEVAIVAYEAKLATAKIDLAAVDRTLALFQPKAGAEIAPYSELGALWKRGEIAALCLAELAREGPLDTAQLAERVAATMGLDWTDETIRKPLVFRIARALSNRLKRESVRSVGRRNGIRIWSEKRVMALFSVVVALAFINPVSAAVGGNHEHGDGRTDALMPSGYLFALIAPATPNLYARPGLALSTERISSLSPRGNAFLGGQLRPGQKILVGVISFLRGSSATT
jgi:hypothetical protein